MQFRLSPVNGKGTLTCNSVSFAAMRKHMKLTDFTPPKGTSFNGCVGYGFIGNKQYCITQVTV